MNKIPHSAFPKFHGLSKEDHDTFLFKFDLLFRRYDYVTNAQNLNLFPATLKSIVLQWFMGLEKDNIHSWEQMKNKFMEKYQYYYKDKEIRKEVFRMMKHEYKILEDYVDRFTYNLQREKQGDLAPKT
jgi:hypothetical protein